MNSLKTITTKLKYLLKNFKGLKFNLIEIIDLTSDLNNKINNLLYS